VVPIVAWIAAGVLAVVVLSFCGYEVGWKARRLRRDLERLARLDERIAVLRAEVTAVQARLALATAGNPGPIR
jgi:hypothetical protein